MDVTLATGFLTKTLDNGETYTIALKNVTDFQILSYGVPTASRTLVNPIQLTQPYARNTQYRVRLHMEDGRYDDIVMGEVANQGTWVNTESGANVARAAIVASV